MVGGNNEVDLTRASGYFWDAIVTLVRRELQIRYKGSVLGLLWAVLSPLGTVVVLSVLFKTILPLNIPHYAAFVYSGLLPWTWFQSAVQIGSATLVDNRDLVRKPFFPRLLLPAVVTSSNFMLYLLALPVLLGLLGIDGLPLTWKLLFLPLIWIVQATFTLACTILVAALGVLIRDVQHLLTVGLLLWFYLTPVFYDLDRIALAQARWLKLNPMTALILAHRSVLLYGQSPDWALLGRAFLVGALLLVISLLVFRALEDAFIEEV